MNHLRSLLAVLLFVMGTISAKAGSVYDYETINGVKYLCLHSTYHAYIVSLPPIYNTEVTIPKTIQHYQNYVLKNYEVVGFEQGIMVPECYGVHSLELPEGFSFNNANLEKVSVDIITWNGKLGAMDAHPDYQGKNRMKVYYTDISEASFAKVATYHSRGFSTVTAPPILNGDSGEGYYFVQNGEPTDAYVTRLNGNKKEIVIPREKVDLQNVSHAIKYFGAPDVAVVDDREDNLTEAAATSITFEGPVTLYSSFSRLKNLEKISFETINNAVDGSCSLFGKLKYNYQIKEVYFTGDRLPNLRGAASDYFFNPENITVYIKNRTLHDGTQVNLDLLKQMDVWKSFKDIKVIGEGRTYMFNIDALHAHGLLKDIQDLNDGESCSREMNVNTPVELYVYPFCSDYELAHCYVDGRDILSQMGQKLLNGTIYRYYKFEDGMSHYVRLEGAASHTVFSSMMFHQSGEGTTTAIATLANGETRELNLPQGTGFGILDVASKDVQKVEVRYLPVHDGKPTVYNGSQQIADEDVKHVTYGNYYYTILTREQLQANDFTVVYPVSYAQQEGTIKTTVAVRNFIPEVSYNFTTGNETVSGTVDNNTTKEAYHQYATGGTYTIYVNGLSNQFRIQENGEDKTSLAQYQSGYWTYAVQHPEQNGLIIVDDGFDMRMNMTASASGIASFRYTDANGTQTKVFSNGSEIYGISSKGRTNQELVVTTNVSFSLYRNSEDISSQYASSNVNADDATKRDYHFLAYGEQNALNFVDGETLNLVLVTAKSIPVMAKSNSVDSRGIKIETFRYGDNSAIVDLHTWGDMALAAVGGIEYLKVYFYHTAEESVKELYINGHKYTGGYESDYRGDPESDNNAGYFAMRFQGVGSTNYSGDYNSLSLEAVFETEGGLDVTKANAVVSMSDESNKAFAELTYDIHREYNSNTSVTETMRKGLKVLEMDKDRLDDDSYVKFELYVPVGYEPKVYVEGLDYTGHLASSLQPSSINGVDYNKYVLRFDSQLMPVYRSQNTSWLVNVSKTVSEARQWNVTLFGAENAEAYVSFYDEVNANKESHRESILSSTVSGNTTVNVPYNAVAASVSAKLYNPDINVTDNYDFVVMADGQDISGQFTYGGENNFYCYNIDPSLLSANSWLIGFKAKNSTLVTHTATLKGDVDNNAVGIRWYKSDGSTAASKALSSTAPNFSTTFSVQPASCEISITLQTGYSFKAYFNDQPVTGFTQNADGKYTASLDAPATDGSWTIDFTKTPAHNIVFADAKVKEICVANWDTDGDGELSTDEAAAVTTLKVDGGNQYSVFNGNRDITSFDELQYFTGLTSIGFQVFQNCTSLASVVLPKTLKGIGVNAFQGCSSLSQIELPETVNNLSSDAFESTSLDNIVIPKSVNNIASNSFLKCNKLASIVVAAANETYDSRNGCNAIIRKSDNTLLIGCKNTVIPEGVTTISAHAFESIDLEKIVIPASVTTINQQAFRALFKLKSVVAKMETPFTLETSRFHNISKDCVLTVPAGKRQAYIDAGWTTEIFKGGIVEEMPSADTNNDGKITVTDAINVMDMILNE